MGNPHPTKSARLPCTRLSRPKKSSIKPVIRVVQIHNPVYVHTDAINFPSLVQKLTGINTCLPASHIEAMHPLSYSPSSSSADDFYRSHTSRDNNDEAACRWSNRADDDASPYNKMSIAWHDSSSQQQSSNSCCGYHNYADAGSPDYTSSEGYDYEDHSNDRGYGMAFSNMSFGVQRFSEVDIWAGLASDHALPDITMLPPLVL